MSAGFIGVGNMGLGIAGNVLTHTRTMTVYDIDEARAKPLLDRQARMAASPREVADTEEVVFQCLPSNAALEAVVNGTDGVKGGKAMKVFVNLGVTGRPATEKLVADLADSGVTVIDAPITGGSKRAADGTLTIMVSGDKAVYESILPMLEAASTKVVYIGEKPGQAQVMKLVNNVMSISNLAIAAEAMVMGAKAGLDPEIMLDVINTGTGQNSASLTKIPDHVLTRGFDYNSTLAIIRKDMTEWLHEAEALGVPMGTCLAARQLFMTAHALFGPKADMSEVVKAVEKLAGCEIPKTR